MVMERPVFPENEHFNFRLCNVTSIYQKFQSNMSLKLPLFHVQNSFSFFLNHSLTFFIFLKTSLRSKAHE